MVQERLYEIVNALVDYATVGAERRDVIAYLIKDVGVEPGELIDYFLFDKKEVEDAILEDTPDLIESISDDAEAEIEDIDAYYRNRYPEEVEVEYDEEIEEATSANARTHPASELLAGNNFTPMGLVCSYGFDPVEVAEATKKLGIEFDIDSVKTKALSSDEVQTAVERGKGIIEKKARKNREELAALEKDKERLILEASELVSNTKAILELANMCEKAGIMFPNAKKCKEYGYGDGTATFVINGEKYSPRLVICKLNNCPYKELYISFTGGREIIISDEKLSMVGDIGYKELKSFLRDFAQFEKAFYRWIEEV